VRTFVAEIAVQFDSVTGEPKELRLRMFDLPSDRSSTHCYFLPKILLYREPPKATRQPQAQQPHPPPVPHATTPSSPSAYTLPVMHSTTPPSPSSSSSSSSPLQPLSPTSIQQLRQPQQHHRGIADYSDTLAIAQQQQHLYAEYQRRALEEKHRFDTELVPQTSNPIPPTSTTKLLDTSWQPYGIQPPWSFMRPDPVPSLAQPQQPYYSYTDAPVIQQQQQPQPQQLARQAQSTTTAFAINPSAQLPASHRPIDAIVHDHIPHAQPTV
jgi:hypothetical protein